MTPKPPMPPVVTVSGLTAQAGATTLLDGLDFTVHPGKVTALVGPSGSGKTTAALALLGESGSGVRLGGNVQVAGTTVIDEGGVRREASALRGSVVAYLPQHAGSSLNPARRIGSCLAELARLHRSSEFTGRADPLVAAALRAAQLPGGRALRRRFPHQFSGGQRQRVALAQTLVCRPTVLVLDEPSTGLDTVTRMHLVSELAELAASGLALLLLSHDHDLVRTLADDVVVLRGGRVLRRGPVADALPEREAPQVDRYRPEDQPGTPVLEVSALSASLSPRGRRPVLHGVDLHLPAGGCVGVVGASGSGKTTLARCLAGLHERYRGQVLLDGVPLPVLRRRGTGQKRRVQYVWQEVRGSFDEHHPVREQVARTAIRLRGHDTGRALADADDLLEHLGLAPGTAGRRPAGLSGGELQRAALARALLADPDVLICDEVTTALDDDTTDVVLRLLADRQRRQGTALLWVSHDLRLVAALAHHVVVLDDGRVVERGDPEHVMRLPRAEATQALVRAAHLGKVVSGPVGRG